MIKLKIGERVRLQVVSGGVPETTIIDENVMISLVRSFNGMLEISAIILPKEVIDCEARLIE